MSVPAITLREPILETDAVAPFALERLGGAARRRPDEVRPVAVINEPAALRWRYGERLDDVVEDACRRFADRPAIAVDGAEISFRELDARANQMARVFIARGVKPGDRVAVLLDRGPEAYVALLALLKARVAYVPLDANHPADRLRYILADSAATLVVSHLRLADRFAGCSAPLMILDKARDAVAAMDDAPLSDDERAAAADSLCYVLYTSGTTGQPKGVAVAHPSICNFVRVAAELYGFGPGERVYQGMSAAFDFSIEELWVPLIAGATLVPNTAATSLFGEELADFLETRAVTCFCCVPTLLASIERDLPKLKILLIGGEACPPALVKRWSREGRALLNSYGPTETTVTATLGRMTPEKPVTIGRPLPTYAIVILDPARDEALAPGEAGEIGIAGIGVAEGYLNRRELTEAKFIPDFLALANNPSGRIYRTGDLGRINDEGEIDYLGRIDTQVKLRGYRIELTEIESVLLEIPDVAQVVATTFEPTPGAPELVAYYSVKHGAPAPKVAALVAHMRSRLPAYMTPAYLERLPFIPTLVSNKADREKLPAPKSPRLRFSASSAPPTTATEHVLCRALGETLGLDEVSIDGDFFNEYGGHSLLMARFCARVRHHAPKLSVAMRDVYANPNVRRLAAALDRAKPASVPVPATPPEHRPSVAAYWATGVAQSAVYVVGAALSFYLLQLSLEWTYAVVDSVGALYLRALVVVAAWFFGHNALAVVAKWLLIGRVRAKSIPLWSLGYFRYWTARLIVRSAPANAFAGTPLYNAFLRMLGARIGRNAVIVSTTVPVAADLFSVGDNAVVCKSALIGGASAYGNRLHLGPVTIGEAAYVGEASVLDIGTTIGAFGQLGHASSLQSGQRIPEGKRYCGSPAEETTTAFRLSEDVACTPLRRALFTLAQLVIGLAVAGALADVVVTVGIALWAKYVHVAGASSAASAWSLLPTTLGLSLLAYVGALVAGLAAVYAIPRLANRFLAPGRIYPLYGFHHAMERIVEGVSNSAFFNLLFGDSVFIEPYLRFVGIRLGKGELAGSNFGSNQMHDNPFLCVIGDGTVASDGMMLGNVTMSNNGFRLGECRVGAHNFLGTDVYVPPGARVGENVLMATKVMAPIDGPVRENVGLLGSPAFEIPRAASRDLELLGRLDHDDRRRRLAEKTRHNLRTMAGLLVSRWFAEFFAIFALALAASVFGATNFLAMFAAGAASLFVAYAVFVFMERASIGFGRLEPEVATVYDPAFWRVERHWKLSDTPVTGLFNGTPMRNVISRLLGVKIGRMVFDDGAMISERSLVEIADGANLNPSCVIQAHSLEEGVFKSDYVRIGADCALGPGAFLHYGVTMGARTMLDPDSFLMKGEITPENSRWRGNPAKMMHQRPAPAAR